MLRVALRNKNTATMSIMFVSALDVVAADPDRLHRSTHSPAINPPQKP